MKKVIVFCLVVLMCLAMAGCGGSETSDKPVGTEQSASLPNNDSGSHRPADAEIDPGDVTDETQNEDSATNPGLPGPGMSKFEFDGSGEYRFKGNSAEYAADPSEFWLADDYFDINQYLAQSGARIIGYRLSTDSENFYHAEEGADELHMWICGWNVSISLAGTWTVMLAYPDSEYAPTRHSFRTDGGLTDMVRINEHGGTVTREGLEYLLLVIEYAVENDYTDEPVFENFGFFRYRFEDTR